jgi:hypothetical protein
LKTPEIPSLFPHHANKTTKHYTKLNDKRTVIIMRLNIVELTFIQSICKH